MDDPLTGKQPGGLRARPVIRGVLRTVIGESRRDPARCFGVETFTVIGRYLPEDGFAQPHRLFQQCFEHRRQIARGAVDDAQHLGGRRLLFQRLPLFGDQPRVLDRDHRLVGEGADQFDLSVGEPLDPMPAEHNDTDCLAFA